MASNLLCPWLAEGAPGDCAVTGEDVVNNEIVNIKAGKTNRIQAKYVPGETLSELGRVDMYSSFAQKDRRLHGGVIHSNDVVVLNCS